MDPLLLGDSEPEREAAGQHLRSQELPTGAAVAPGVSLVVPASASQTGNMATADAAIPPLADPNSGEDALRNGGGLGNNRNASGAEVRQMDEDGVGAAERRDSDEEMGDEMARGQMEGQQGEEGVPEPAITHDQAQAMQALVFEDPIRELFDGYEDVSIPPAKLDNIKIAQEYVEDIQAATLDNGGLSGAARNRLRNAEPASPLTEAEKFHLQFYMALSDTSERIFDDARKVVNESCGTAIPTQFVLRSQMERVTGITAIEDDICVKGCHAFTGPRFGVLEKCAVCGEDRYDPKVLRLTGKKVARKRMTTIPLGLMVQALRRSKSGAEAMRYRDKKTQEIFEFLQNEGSLDDMDRDDIFCGRDYLELAANLGLTEDDTVVNFSMDGAQLYQNKKSDTWIAIWVVQDFDPKERFKKKYMLPAIIIPGPDKPKNLDSYTYRSMHHLSALQREDNGKGIKCWDAEKGKQISTRVVSLVKNADAVGLPDIDGRVGHHGVRGCRIGCDMPGRNKPEQGHYYAVHLRPIGYTVAENNHPDIDVRSIKSPTVDEYNTALTLVESSPNKATYEENRKKTGIAKRSIVSGLVQIYNLPPPKCFTVDLMHIPWINAGELLIPLWRGKLKCEPPDDIRMWDWAVFMANDVWTKFGKQVAAATPYFPSFFHRPPRNPALKINSKYKATEYFLLLFGLGPGLLRSFLPHKYWRHFCKLARAVRMLTLRKIKAQQLREARLFMIQFVEEYELLYYQRLPERIHFCRPLLHTFLHTPLEAERVGPGTYTTQFENERAIGDFGKEIRQPSNPFGNLARIAVRSAQKNALKMIYPELELKKRPPRGARTLPNGYMFLSPNTKEIRIEGHEGRFLLQNAGTDIVQKYGRLELSNGQIVRSVYSESTLIKREPRISRNVRVSIIIMVNISHSYILSRFLLVGKEMTRTIGTTSMSSQRCSSFSYGR